MSSRPQQAARSGAVAPNRAAIGGWLLFDWACQPFFTLVTTFVFAPYFAAALAPDPALGQAWWGYATAAAGLVLGLSSPVLGSIADAFGRRKPWIAVSCAVLAAASASLWFAAPGSPVGIPLALTAFAIGTVAAEVAAVFNNAMMMRLVGAERLGRLSGTGWATGYAGGLVCLLVVLGFFVATPESGRTYLGLTPLFGLDPAEREGDRFVGPFAAAWLVLFVWPLFAFTPDAAGTGRRVRDGVREGFARLRATLGEVRAEPTRLRFLLGNMIYQDALVALFAFGGIYGAGLFGWGATQLGIFGVLLTITGTIGAMLGGRLDDRFGAKPVIVGALLCLLLVCVGVSSLGRSHVLFVIPTEPPAAGGAIFGSAPERVFVALGAVIGAVAGPLQASSRAYLGRLVPADDAGRYFGLLAVSGKLTSFLAPLLVALATQATGRLEAAPVVLIGFFTTALVLIRGVRRA